MWYCGNIIHYEGFPNICGQSHDHYHSTPNRATLILQQIDMGTLRNVESSTLLQFTAVLTAAIALDLFKVVSKLFKAGLISQAQFRAAHLQTKGDQQKASELVTQIIEQVKQQPDKFAVFLRVLEAAGVSQRVVRDVRMQYEANRAEAEVI